MKKTLISLVLAGLGLAVMLVSSPQAAEPAHLGEEEIRQSYHDSYRYEKTQNYEDAIKALAPVFAAYPEGYTVNLRLGWLDYLSGHYADAKARYQVAMKAAPDSLEAKLGYTLPLLAQERYEEVESVARQILRVDPANYYANLRLGFVLRQQRKFDAAAEVLNRALVLYPTDVKLLTELGLVEVAQGKSQAGRRVLADVLTLDPENVTAKAQLASLATMAQTNMAASAKR